MCAFLNWACKSDQSGSSWQKYLLKFRKGGMTVKIRAKIWQNVKNLAYFLRTGGSSAPAGVIMGESA